MKKVLLTVSVLALGAFGHAESVNSETEKAAMSLGAQQVTQVGFSEGRADLTDAEKTELRDLVAQAKAAGKIKEIKVIAWADREYPAEGTTAPNQQVKIADQRAENIEKFLKKDLKVSDVAVYNMAKRPNTLQELFNTQTNKVKGKLETAGAAPTAKEDTGIFGYKGKASEALVLVYNK